MDKEMDVMRGVHMTTAQREAYAQICEMARTWISMRDSVGPLCRAIVCARTEEEGQAACKALAKWMDDDLDAALNGANDQANPTSEASSG